MTLCLFFTSCFLLLLIVAYINNLIENQEKKESVQNIIGPNGTDDVFQESAVAAISSKMKEMDTQREG